MRRIWTVGLLFSGFLGVAQGPNLKKDYSAVENKVIEWRRDIHENPELSNREFETAKKVSEHLKSLGIDVQTEVAHTGVVGVLKGKKNGKTIALRADMDALPVLERNDLPYKSTVKAEFKGEEVPVMHACGHDTHTAILMGVAEVLSKNKDKIKGTVKFIFQPAEEGFSGAKKMIDDGLFTQFPMEAVFGMHNWPGMAVGTFGVKAGPMMASSNTFEVQLEGKGAHGGMPHLGVDPVMAAVQLAQSFQTIISRERDPLEPIVLSITQIHAGSADNVIPNKATMRGTVRTFSDAALDFVERRMAEITSGLSASHPMSLASST